MKKYNKIHNYKKVYTVYMYVIDGKPAYIGCGKGIRPTNYLSIAYYYNRYKRIYSGMNKKLIKKILKTFKKSKKYVDFSVRRFFEGPAGEKKMFIRINRIKNRKKKLTISRPMIEKIEKLRKKYANMYVKGSYLYRYVNPKLQIISLKDVYDDPEIAREYESMYIKKFSKKYKLHNINS